MKAEKMWKQNLRLSQSLFEMKDELKYAVDIFAESFKQQTGSLPAFHYFTFNYDDFQSRKVTFSVFSDRQTYLYLTAPEEAIERAIDRVKIFNKHLRFTEFLAGHNGDDLLYNRITVRFKIFSIEEQGHPPASNYKDKLFNDWIDSL